MQFSLASVALLALSAAAFPQQYQPAPASLVGAACDSNADCLSYQSSLTAAPALACEPSSKTCMQTVTCDASIKPFCFMDCMDGFSCQPSIPTPFACSRALCRPTVLKRPFCPAEVLSCSAVCGIDSESNPNLCHVTAATESTCGSIQCHQLTDPHHHRRREHHH